MTSHPEYAKEAAQYAYDDMYKTDSPIYNLEPWLYQKKKSYCSKYVYLALLVWRCNATTLITIFLYFTLNRFIIRFPPIRFQLFLIFIHQFFTNKKSARSNRLVTNKHPD